MPNVWKIDGNGDPYLETQQQRGRKLGSGAQNAASKALVPPQPELPSPVETGRESVTFGDVWKDAANNISQAISRGAALDETVIKALQARGYDADQIAADPQKFAPILHSIQDDLTNEVKKYNENMGEYGGTGSLGQHTLDKANEGKNLRSGNVRDK